MGAECAGGIDDLDGFAVTGDGFGEGVPLVGGEVVGVFEAIGPGALSGVERLPVSVGNCICIPVAVLSGWLRRRMLSPAQDSYAGHTLEFVVVTGQDGRADASGGFLLTFRGII